MNDKLAGDILDRIATHAGMDREALSVDTELTELGIHSLELTEIIFDIEEAYGIEVEMNTTDAWSRLKNVGDVIAAVSELVAKKG